MFNFIVCGIKNLWFVSLMAAIFYMILVCEAI